MTLRLWPRPRPAAARSVLTAYVLNCGSDSDASVLPIDLATGTAGTPISGAGIGSSDIVITPDGATAYTTNTGDQAITPISTATNTSGSSIPFIGDEPYAIAITPDGATAYVTDIYQNIVTPVELATSTVGSPIAVGTDPQAIAITPDGGTAYVTNTGDNTVTPVGLAAAAARTPIPVGAGPEAIAITPDGASAYVVNGAITPCPRLTWPPAPRAGRSRSAPARALSRSPGRIRLPCRAASPSGRSGVIRAALSCAAS